MVLLKNILSIPKRLTSHIALFCVLQGAVVDKTVAICSGVRFYRGKEKCELLVMGADDEKIEAALEPNVKVEIRQKYGIENDDFLIMMGGRLILGRPKCCF